MVSLSHTHAHTHSLTLTLSPSLSLSLSLFLSLSLSVCLSVSLRVCEITSVDDSNISTYCVHECEAINRVGMRSRRFIFTGHVNGSVQVRPFFYYSVNILHFKLWLFLMMSKH